MGTGRERLIEATAASCHCHYRQSRTSGKTTGVATVFCPARRGTTLRRLIAATVAGGLAIAANGGAAQAAPEKPKVAPEKQLKQLDANKDDKVSQTEFVVKVKNDAEKKAKAEKRFAKLDKNWDVFLTLDEFKAMPKKRKKP